MKIKLVPNPEFDFFIGYLGGDEIPTKQDKFKPIVGYDKISGHKGEDVDELPTNQMYLINPKKKLGQKSFEDKFKKLIKENLQAEHPYKKPLRLEVVISIKMTEKRLKKVDIDNLIKSILDCFNGLVFEDDNQVNSVLASKYIIKDELIPQLNGVQVGIRKLDKRESWLANIAMYDFEEIKE